MAKQPSKRPTAKISKYSLAERVAYLRKKRSLTQAEVAKLTKLSQSTITQIENGKKDPSIETVQKLAKALDVHVAVLFAEEDVHVFDMKKLRSKYKNVDDLNETLYRAVGEVLRFARAIDYSK